jgi:tyrosine-protein kinase Etk/Wzc
MTNFDRENQSAEVNPPPLSGKVTRDEINLLDLLQTCVDNLRLLVLLPLVTGLIALACSYLIPDTYTAKTQFLPPQQQQSSALNLLSSLGALGGSLGGIKSPADQYIAFLRSNRIKDELIDRFKLIDRWKLKTRTEARFRLDAVQIVFGKDGLMIIEVDDKDPQFASDLANAHVEELGRLLGKLATTEAQQRRKFFENQLIQAKDNFIKSEIALKSIGISESVLKSNPATAVAFVAGLQASISSLEIKLGAMRSYLAESAPEYKQTVAELENLRIQLKRQEKDKPLLDSKTADIGDYVSKYREYKYNEVFFELLVKQLEIAKIDEAREIQFIQVLDFAKPPEKKSKPNKTLIAIIATLISGFAMLFYILLREFFRKSNQDLETGRKLISIKYSLRKALGYSVQK